MRMNLRRGYRAWGKHLGELLIVAVGVVLGLAATEWVSERKTAKDVAEARAALKDELSNNYDVAQMRHEVAPCVRRRIADLRGWIARHRAGDTRPLPLAIGRPATNRARFSVWDVVKTGQVAAKMPLSDKITYASIYDSFVNFDMLVINERDLWFAIGDFAGMSSLPESDLQKLQGLLSRASAFEEAQEANYPRLMKRLQSLGIEASSQQRQVNSARRAICQPFPGSA